MSQILKSGSQNMGVSALASVLPMNIQDWFPLGWTRWVSLKSKGLSRVFSNTSSKAIILWSSPFLIVQLLHLYMTTRKTIALTVWNFVGLCFLICCLGLSYFPSKKKVSFNFMLAVTIYSDFGAQENKVCHCFNCFSMYLPWSNGTGCCDLNFLNVEL